MTDSILRCAGYRTGLFTSPHLVRVTERIRVDGRDISTSRFADLVTRIEVLEKQLLGEGALDIPLTYFEILTAGMFLHFAEAKVEAAVIEVGLGGSLDATNVVRPGVGVITGISLDHQNLLGSTLARIAGEKAGIIKKNVPVISGASAAEAREVISAKAAAEGAPLIEIGRACRISLRSVRHGRCILDLDTPRRRYRALRLALAGEHQARNAALAVMAAESLGLAGITARVVHTGLARASWAGRLDEYRCPRRTLLDGAHNAEGARMLGRHLRRYAPEEIRLVFGVLRDKDFGAIGGQLFPLARSIHLSPVASPRSAPPSAVAARHARYRERLHVHWSAQEALRAAWQECSPAGIVVVTGSLYLLGELLPLIRRESRAAGH